MCIVGTIWPSRYRWSLAMCTSSLVAEKTWSFSDARPGERAQRFRLAIRLARTPRYGKLSSAARRMRGFPLKRIWSVSRSVFVR